MGDVDVERGDGSFPPQHRLPGSHPAVEMDWRQWPDGLSPYHDGVCPWGEVDVVLKDALVASRIARKLATRGIGDLSAPGTLLKDREATCEFF